MCLWIIAGFDRAFAQDADAPATVIDTAPRTDAPLETLTRFYTRKDFTVKGKASDFLWDQEGNLQYDLTYYWFQPEGAPYPKGLKFPLVLLLHGTPGIAYAGEYLIQSKMQLDFPAFIAVPVQQKGWLWDSPKQFQGYPDAKVPPHAMRGLAGAVQLVKTLVAEYPVDTSRIYVVGCSEGGFGAFGAALKYPDIFAAAVPISGGWTFSDAPQMTKLPLWVFQGGIDTAVQPSLPRTLTGLIKQHGGSVNYTEFPNMGHDCPSPSLYTVAMWKWLFSQHK